MKGDINMDNLARKDDILENNNVLSRDDSKSNILYINPHQKRIEEIKSEILKLTKGHIIILYRREKGYYYLTYRDGKKINNDYLGPVGKADLKDIMDNLSKRDKLKNELRSLKEEIKELKKKAKTSNK